jgi:hypothetical protein
MKPNIDKLAREAADAEIAVEKQQPTPTGEQEWTAEKVASFLTTRGGCIGGQGKLADAINADLASEREKRELAESLFQQRDKEMTENLALAVKIEDERNQLREQLAEAQAGKAQAGSSL